MASRYKVGVKELWPQELVAMSGGIQGGPELKSLMKKVFQYYNGIPSNSPEQPLTVQKTVKRRNNDSDKGSVSMKKRGRTDQNSQDQTTTKKKNSSSVGAPVSLQEIVTPAKDLLPQNKLSNIVKNISGNSGQKKPLKLKVSTRGTSGISSSSGKITVLTSNNTNSALKKEQIAQAIGLSSSKKNDDTRLLKSTESRKDSQPSKNTHPVLLKQDSSRYLRGEEKRQLQA